VQKEAFDLLKKYEHELTLNEEVRFLKNEFAKCFESTANQYMLYSVQLTGSLSSVVSPLRLEKLS